MTHKPKLQQKKKKKIKFLNSKHSSEILFDFRDPNVNSWMKIEKINVLTNPRMICFHGSAFSQTNTRNIQLKELNKLNKWTRQHGSSNTDCKWDWSRKAPQSYCIVQLIKKWSTKMILISCLSCLSHSFLFSSYFILHCTSNTVRSL